MGNQQASLRENRASDNYDEALRKILKRADVLDAKAIRDLRRLVREIQARVNERLALEILERRADRTWNQFWVPRLNRSITDVIQELSRKAGGRLGEYLAASWELGTDMIDLPLRATKGLEVLAPAISRYTLTVLAPFSARLVTGISETTRAAIDQTLRVGISLGESPGEIMEKLQMDLRGDSSPWRTIAYKSEIVTRTEVARVQQLATEARMDAARLEFSELDDEMKQIFVSVQMGPWPCKVCEPLDGTIWSVSDRRKPVPPMHPNCRCVLAPYFPGLSTPPKPRAERQADASLTECGCCG